MPKVSNRKELWPTCCKWVDRVTSCSHSGGLCSQPKSASFKSQISGRQCMTMNQLICVNTYKVYESSDQCACALKSRASTTITTCDGILINSWAHRLAGGSVGVASLPSTGKHIDPQGHGPPFCHVQSLWAWCWLQAWHSHPLIFGIY